MWKTKLFKALPYLFSNFLALLVIGALELFVFGWSEASWEQVLTNMGIMLLANTLVLNSSINSKVDEEKLSNDKYSTIVNDNKSLKRKIKPNVEEFLKIINTERKIIAFKLKIQKQLNKRNLKPVRRTHLYSLLEDEYIEKNINNISIEYPKVKESFLKVGYNNDSEYEYIIHSDNSAKFFDLLPRYLFNLILILVIVFFRPGFQNPDSWKDYSFVTGLRLLGLAWNWGYGKYYGSYFMNNKLIPDEQYRQDLIIRYLEWDKERSEIDGNKHRTIVETGLREFPIKQESSDRSTETSGTECTRPTRGDDESTSRNDAVTKRARYRIT